MKLDTLMENRTTVTVKSSKSKPDVEFPYVVRLFPKSGSGSISAMD